MMENRIGQMARVGQFNEDAVDFAMPLFDGIDLFLDETPRSGPEQMALDQALLENASRPLLRPYRWSEAAVSFGYSQAVMQVRRQFPSSPCVRRWTGGGIVWHHGDWTFALIVPTTEPLARVRPAVTYHLIHAQIMTALKACGYSARLAESPDCQQGMSCFASPASYDVLGPDRRKLCGGAQRRTRQGFLHQGSIQHVPLPQDFAERLLATLARDAWAFFPTGTILARANDLVALRYATTTWLERI
jgi:lipoyl(octanoyl) transferase